MFYLTIFEQSIEYEIAVLALVAAEISSAKFVEEVQDEAKVEIDLVMLKY